MLKRSSIDRSEKLVLTWLAIGLAAVLSAACGSEPEESAPVAQADLQTTEVELTTIPERYEALGTVRSTTRSTIASKLMGTVMSVAVNEGDRVRKGQILLEIDAREVDAQIRKADAGLDEVERAIQSMQAALSSAEANLNLATATYRRYEALRERRSVSPQEFDEVEARYKAAQAERTRVSSQLEGLHAKRQQALADVSTARTYGTWARITSPIDGVVTAKHVDVGDQASPGMPLVQIDDPSSYRLDVQVDESRLPYIQIGDPVPVWIESSDLRTTGSVQAVAPAVDPSTRSALVKIDLPEMTGLQSGMFARAWFSVGERQALVVPTSSITRRGQLEGVYVLDDAGGAQFRLIRTGESSGEETEVLSGISAGDKVVIGGLSGNLEHQPVAANAAARAVS